MASRHKPKERRALKAAKAAAYAVWTPIKAGGLQLAIWAQAGAKGFLPFLDDLKKAIAGLAFAGLAILLVWVGVSMTRNSEYYIAPIGLPDDLKKAGASEFTVSHGLRTQLEQIRRIAFGGGVQYSEKFNLTIRSQRPGTTPDSVDYRPLRHLDELPDLAVPDSNISLVTLAAYLREVFGLSHARITGDIIEVSQGQYVFRGSINGTPIFPDMATPPFAVDRLPDLLRVVALLAESEYEPDIAALYLSKKDPDAGVALLRRYLESADAPPRHYAWAFNLWGNILRGQERYRDAIDKYRRALQLAPAQDPINASIHSNLGALYLLLKDFKTAETEFSAAVAVQRNARYLSNLAIAQRHLGRTDDAKKTYEDAIALDPSYAPAYSNLGNLLDDEGHWQDAIAKFNAAIAVQPGFADAYHNLAFLYAAHDMPDDSLSAYLDTLTFEGWSNLHTIQGLESVLTRYLAQTPLDPARRRRALGIYCKYLKSLTAPELAPTQIAAALGNPACEAK